MNAPRPRSIGRALQNVARQTQLLLVSVAVMAFVLLVRCSLNQQTELLLGEQARTAAAALLPARGGDLTDAVAALQARNERLLAVGTLDPRGKVTAVYPDSPALHAAVTASLIDLGETTVVTSALTDETIAATAIVVPLDDGRSPTSRQVVMLFRTPVEAANWLPAAAIFTLIMAIVSFLNQRCLSRWFDGQVARPLREMATTLPHGGESVPLFKTNAWHETTQIAHRFRELLQTLEDTNSRTRRLEREAKRQILCREIGFSRELRKARDRATTDPLTGLKNRSFLQERIERVFEQHQARNTELSAVMIDLDNFKAYNDSQGHQVGDALLRFAGALLRGAIRPSDCAVRYGGDEFLLLLSGTDLQQAAGVAERLVKLFHEYASQLDQCDVSMSAGVAAARGCRSGQELVNCADAKLYAAKRAGKNRVAGAESTSQPAPAAA